MLDKSKNGLGFRNFRWAKIVLIAKIYLQFLTLRKNIGWAFLNLNTCIFSFDICLKFVNPFGCITYFIKLPRELRIIYGVIFVTVILLICGMTLVLWYSIGTQSYVHQYEYAFGKTIVLLKILLVIIRYNLLWGNIWTTYPRLSKLKTNCLAKS